MSKTLLLTGIVLAGLCSTGQAQSSNTNGPRQSPTRDAGQDTTGPDQNKNGQRKTAPNSPRAEDGQGQPATTGSQVASTMSITGCLQRGSADGKFIITGSDGKKHDVSTSDNSIKLNDHVGHRVTLNCGQADDANRANSSNKSNGQPATVDVTALTMVSRNCH